MFWCWRGQYHGLHSQSLWKGFWVKLISNNSGESEQKFSFLGWNSIYMCIYIIQIYIHLWPVNISSAASHGDIIFFFFSFFWGVTFCTSNCRDWFQFYNLCSVTLPYTGTLTVCYADNRLHEYNQLSPETKILQMYVLLKTIPFSAQFQGRSEYNWNIKVLHCHAVPHCKRYEM